MRFFTFVVWSIIGLAIGFGLKFGYPIQHHLGPLWESAKKSANRIESGQLPEWLSPSQTLAPKNGPISHKPASPPTAPVWNNLPERKADLPKFVELVLHPGENGHFFTPAQINGHSVTVLVDTGASSVSVPANLQAELELPLGRPMTFTTASDRYPSHGTTIRNLVLGPILLQNIEGDLNPRSPDGKILLGMSALKNLEMVHKNNTLTLRAPASMAVNDSVNYLSATGKSTGLLIMKRSVRECMGKGNMIDQKALECIQGN